MAEKKTVKLKIGPASWQTHEFDPSVEGVPVIDQEGVDVPASKVEEVKAQAKANDLTLSEVKEG